MTAYFPGNQLILELGSVRITAANKHRVDSAYASDLSTMEHGSHEVMATIESRYASDPLVMRLLQLYLDTEERVRSLESTKSEPEDVLHPTLANAWQSYHP